MALARRAWDDQEMRSERPQQPVPDSASWHAVFQDLQRQHGFEALSVEGTLPSDLCGTLIRNGPGMFTGAEGRFEHLFDADGAVSAVRIANGAAEGAVRLVESEATRRERKWGKCGHAGWATPGRLWRMRNSANTNVMRYQGAYLALYEAGRPTALAPDTLQSLGEVDLGGVVLGAFSAHPSYVPQRKATYNFGVRYGLRTSMDVYELADEGPARRLLSLPLSGAPVMFHDFVATENHLVFFVPPLRLRAWWMLLSGAAAADNTRWKPDLGTEVIVVPIDDPASYTRFKTDPFFQWHFANAFEDQDAIVVDVMRYPDYGTGQWLADLYARGNPGREADGTLHRLVVQPRERRVKSWELNATPGEFPTIDPQQATQRHDAIYMAGHSSVELSARSLQDVLVRVCPESGQSQQFSLGPGCFPGEPLIAGRHLLSMVYDAGSHRTFVAVMERDRLEAGPVARIHFDQHIPLSFHGQWIPASERALKIRSA